MVVDWGVEAVVVVEDGDGAGLYRIDGVADRCPLDVLGNAERLLDCECEVERSVDLGGQIRPVCWLDWHNPGRRCPLAGDERFAESLDRLDPARRRRRRGRS